MTERDLEEFIPNPNERSRLSRSVKEATRKILIVPDGKKERVRLKVEEWRKEEEAFEKREK